jgi:hypothetical protein
MQLLFRLMLLLPFTPFAPYSFLPKQLQATALEAESVLGIAIYKIS